MRVRRATLIAATILAVSAGTVSAGSWETANVRGQGLAGPMVSGAEAAILRTSTGVQAHLTMATPAPGSYTYPSVRPAAALPVTPRCTAFWVFVFFNPEACSSDPCGPMDLINDPDVIAGAFNAGGHVTGGQNLTLAGSVESQPLYVRWAECRDHRHRPRHGLRPRLCGHPPRGGTARRAGSCPAAELDLDAGRRPGPLVDLDLPATAVKNSDAAGGFPARGTPAVSG